MMMNSSGASGSWPWLIVVIKVFTAFTDCIIGSIGSRMVLFNIALHHSTIAPMAIKPLWCDGTITRLNYSSEAHSMGRVNVYLPDELEKRLKDYVYKKTGSFRGQSEIAVEAIKEYLERHEPELEKSKNP